MAKAGDAGHDEAEKTRKRNTVDFLHFFFPLRTNCGCVPEPESRTQRANEREREKGNTESKHSLRLQIVSSARCWRMRVRARTAKKKQSRKVHSSFSPFFHRVLLSVRRKKIREGVSSIRVARVNFQCPWSSSSLRLTRRRITELKSESIQIHLARLPELIWEWSSPIVILFWQGKHRTNLAYSASCYVVMKRLKMFQFWRRSFPFSWLRVRGSKTNPLVLISLSFFSSCLFSLPLSLALCVFLSCSLPFPSVFFIPP